MKSITELINKAIRERKYIDCLKIAKVIPIHRGDLNVTVIIIDQYLHYQHFIKYLKKSSK